MKQALLKMIESGQLNKLIANYDTIAKCGNPKGVEGVPLTYQRLFLLFIIMGFGMMMGSLVLLIEVCYKPKLLLTKSRKIMPKCKNQSTQTWISLNYTNFFTFSSNWCLPDLLSLRRENFTLCRGSSSLKMYINHFELMSLITSFAHSSKITV